MQSLKEEHREVKRESQALLKSYQLQLNRVVGHSKDCIAKLENQLNLQVKENKDLQSQLLCLESKYIKMQQENISLLEKSRSSPLRTAHHSRNSSFSKQRELSENKQFRSPSP